MNRFDEIAKKMREHKERNSPSEVTNMQHIYRTDEIIDKVTKVLDDLPELNVEIEHEKKIEEYKKREEEFLKILDDKIAEFKLYFKSEWEKASKKDWRHRLHIRPFRFDPSLAGEVLNQYIEDLEKEFSTIRSYAYVNNNLRRTPFTNCVWYLDDQIFESGLKVNISVRPRDCDLFIPPKTKREIVGEFLELIDTGSKYVIMDARQAKEMKKLLG